MRVHFCGIIRLIFNKCTRRKKNGRKKLCRIYYNILTLKDNVVFIYSCKIEINFDVKTFFKLPFIIFFMYFY